MNADITSENVSMKYDAFISYSHKADNRLAPAIQRAIHKFAKPWYRLRAARTFRDQTNLSISPHLWTSIESALSNSRFFLLFASPQAAKSKWVNKEVDFWIRKRSPETILMVLTNGSLIWNDAILDFDPEKTNALPTNLYHIFKQEPFYIDLSWAKTDNDFSFRHTKFQESIGKIAAAIRGVEPDLLFGEDVRQQNRTRLLATIVGSFLLILTVYSSFTTIKERQAKNEALTHLANNYLIQGRRELINGSNLHALAYIAEANRVLPSSSTAEYMLSQAMRVANNQKILNYKSSGYKKSWLNEKSGRALLLGNDGTIEVWDWINNLSLSQITGYFEDKDYISLTKDGGKLITAKENEPLKIWSAENGSIIFEPQEYPLQVRKAVVDSQGKRMVAIDSELVLWLWDLSTEKLIKKIDFNVWDADLSSTGEYLVTGSGNGLLGVWNATDGNNIGFLESSKNTKQKPAVWHFVSFDPNQNRFIAISENTNENEPVPEPIDEAIIVNLAENPEETNIRPLKGHKYFSKGTFSPDGKLVATYGGDGTIALWDLENEKLITKFENHHRKELCSGWLFFSRDSKKLLAIAAGPMIPKVWDLETKSLLTSIDGPRTWIIAANFGNTNDSLITVDTDGFLRSWKLGSDYQIPIDNKIGDIDAATFNRDATRVAVGATHFNAVIDSSNGAILKQINMEEGELQSTVCAFSPDGVKILNGGVGTGVKLWDILTNQNNRIEKEKSLITWDAVFSPDGMTYASVEFKADATLRVWQVSNDNPIWVLPLEVLTKIAFSPEGDDIVAKSKEGIKIFNIPTKAPKQHLKAIEEDCFALTYNPDGTRIGCAGGNGNLYIWDATSGDLIQLLQGHRAQVRDIQYSFDGSRMITASMDGTVRVWDASTGDLLSILNGGAGPLIAVNEIKDEGTILTISVSGMIQKWNQSKKDLDNNNIANKLKCYSPWDLGSGGIVPRDSTPSNCKDS